MLRTFDDRRIPNEFGAVFTAQACAGSGQKNELPIDKSSISQRAAAPRRLPRHIGANLAQEDSLGGTALLGNIPFEGRVTGYSSSSEATNALPTKALIFGSGV